MKAVVDHCQKAGIKVILYTTSNDGAGDSAQSKQLGAYSEFIRGLAREKRCVLIDLYPTFVDALRKADTLSPERLQGEDDARGLPAEHTHMCLRAAA
jgi:hypothetical protein